MTPEQKALIRDTWRQVVPIADTAAAMFYDRLFALDPSTRSLFQSADMAAQRQKLVQALALVVASLDDLAELMPVLEDLGRRHLRYGVVDGDYQTVGEALLWTLEHGLGEAWSPAAADAWTEAYTLTAGVMRRAASDMANAA